MRMALSVLLTFCPPRPPRTHRVDLQVLVANLNFNFGGFREHGDRGSTRMHATLRFGFRHALHAVPAALELQIAERPFAAHGKCDFPHAPQFRRRKFHDFDLPVLGLCVLLIHVEQIASEQGRFIATCPRADFHDQAAARQCVAGQHHVFQFRLQRRQGALQPLQFFFRVSLGFGIGFLLGHLARRGHVGFQPIEFAHLPRHFHQPSAFALQLGQFLGIGEHSGILKLSLQILKLRQLGLK